MSDKILTRAELLQVKDDLLAMIVEEPEVAKQFAQAIQTQLPPQPEYRELIAELRQFYAETQQRFETVERKLTKHDQRLEAIERKLAEHDELLQTIVIKLQQHDEEFRLIRQKFEQIDRRFEQIDRRFEQIDQRFDKLERDVGQLKGDTLEQRIHNTAPSIFGQYLTRGRVITNSVLDTAYEARVKGKITEAEYTQVVATDLLWGGKVRQTRQDVVLVIEISWKVDLSDVNRATQRANILEKAGFVALPVVIGREWDRATLETDVVRVSNGRIDSDSWPEAMK